jgi:hypothetical protein
MKRLRIEQDRSLVGHPDNWMVVAHSGVQGHAWSVLFRGTYCECLKEAEKYVKTKHET